MESKPKKQRTLAYFFKPKDGTESKLSKVVDESQSTQKTQAETQERLKEEIKQVLDTEGFDYEELKKNYKDGRRIFNNRLIYYKTYRPDMITFPDLFKADIGLNSEEQKSENIPETAVIASFLVEDKFLGKHVISKGIECTIFKHGYMDTQNAKGKSVLDYPGVKMR